MASITTWMRLEPHSRAAGMEAGLEMRIHDPLWLLARQWQFGEFQGEDTGSPVWASCSGEDLPISLYLPGPIDGHASSDVLDYSTAIPLEFLVEQERTPASVVMAANRRLAVEAGQQFLRLLGRSLAGVYRASLLQSLALEPLTADERSQLDMDSVIFIDWMAGRALDGARLLAAVQQSVPADRAENLGFARADHQAASQAISDWLDWCEQVVGVVGQGALGRASWDSSRMEYSCALAAPVGTDGNQIVLASKAYRGGHLDWYAFDGLVGQKLQREITSPSLPVNVATVPTPLSFRGLPASRLWEFEDAQVRFGSIQAAPTDLARLLLVEFLIEYGNDFFTIPIELPSGSLFQIQQLAITNTFGDVITAQPFSDQAWRMFALSTEPVDEAQSLSSMLFLPPVLGQSLGSPPIEEVHLLRDEMANMAWAVEHIVESKGGKPLNRHEAFLARHQAGPSQQPSSGAAPLVYRLDTWETAVPDYWIPLLPEQLAPGLSPVRLACFDLQGNSLGRLLAEHDPASWLYLYDGEVPRMGRQIRRTHRYARWYDGEIFAWIGREKRPGRGEGSSGLRYDVVDATHMT